MDRTPATHDESCVPLREFLVVDRDRDCVFDFRVNRISITVGIQNTPVCYPVTTAGDHMYIYIMSKSLIVKAKI